MLIYPVFILKIQIKTIQNLSLKDDKDNSIKKMIRRKETCQKTVKKQLVVKVIKLIL